MRPTDELVREFHHAFGFSVNDTVALVPRDVSRLRLRLIREEYEEVRKEFEALFAARDIHAYQAALIGLAKELADLRYVIDGANLTFGFDGPAVFREVHRSNMSKLGTDGKPIYRADGKALKGPNYREADVASVLALIIDVESDEV